MTRSAADPAHTAAAPPAERTDGYLPLRGYAAIGDGRTVALIGEDGQIDWWPIPNLDKTPVIGALLDAEHGGHLALRPTGPGTVRREYVSGTNVLATTWSTPTGQCRITDAMVTGIAGRLPWAQLTRRIDGISGTVDLQWALDPGTMLATQTPSRQDTGNGSVLTIDGVTLAVITDGPAWEDTEDSSFAGTLTTGQGSRHSLTIVGTDNEPVFLPNPHDADIAVDRTIANWQQWSDAFTVDGRWADPVRRSMLALKLLIHAPSGAIAAAATTSLPEDLTGGKNWDYRFAWVRDLALTVRALNRYGIREETHAAMSWLVASIAEHSDDMPIFYTLACAKRDDVDERDLPGWMGIGPVTEGNRAADQIQLSVWGDVFGIVGEYVDAGNVLDRRTAAVLERLADNACIRWEEDDAGLWELTELRPYLSGKLGCWQALTTAIRLHDAGMIDGDRDRWQHNQHLLETWVETDGWNEEVGSYVMYAGGTAIDTSVLIWFLAGYTGRTGRMSSTLDVIRAQLAVGPLVYRYSGMDQEESPFVACSFWLAAAYALDGRLDEAEQLMQDTVDLANDVGLFTEMIHADTHDFIGNYPQALSHLALLQAADIIHTARRHANA